MTIICITGQPRVVLQEVEESLRIRGVDGHVPLHRDPSFDMMRWHDCVQEAFDSKKIKETQGNKDGRQGRLWEQLAIDLILSNMESKVWAWAHAHAVHHLDFWVALESGMRFVLLCEDLSTMIGRIIEEGVECQHIQAHVAEWELAHRNMLRFHLRNPTISVMRWASDSQLNMGRLIQDVNQICGIHLDATIASDPAAVRSPNKLVREITSKLLVEYSNANDLEQEIKSVIGYEVDALGGAGIIVDQLVDEYRKIKDRSVELAEIKTLEFKIKKNQKIISENTEKLTNIERQYFDALNAKEVALKRIDDITAEKDLLLGQLHKVQDELGVIYLKSQQEEKTFEEKISSIRAESKVQLDESLIACADLQSKVSNEMLAHKKTRGDLDSSVERINELEKSLAAENQAKGDLRSRMTIAADQIARLESQNKSEGNAKDTALNKVDHVAEENDLLLSQLYQVQEELEKYYLKQQAESSDHKRLQERWQRALLKHPEVQRFEAIELVSEGADGGSINWQLNHLVIKGEIYGPFDFRTVVENGVTGFVFPKSTESKKTLKAWPLLGQDDAELVISPVAGKGDPQKRRAAMLQLCASDWLLLQQLNALLTHWIDDHGNELKSAEVNLTLSGLKSCKDLMDQLPAWLKFDKVRLLGQQVTPKKQVLALQLLNADLTGHWLDQVSFQLQLNINTGVGAHSMHLIFDKSHSNTTFENWKSNLSSSGGEPVMALEIRSTGWDALLWNQLGKKDRLWIQSLVYRIPFILQLLRMQGERVEKESPVWKAAIANLIAWSSVPVADQVAATVLVDTPPDSPSKRGALGSATKKTKASWVVTKAKLVAKKTKSASKTESPKGSPPVVKLGDQIKKSLPPSSVDKHSYAKPSGQLKNKNKKMSPAIKGAGSKPSIKKYTRSR